jgi:hypothetical protein
MQLAQSNTLRMHIVVNISSYVSSSSLMLCTFLLISRRENYTNSSGYLNAFEMNFYSLSSE